MRSTSIPMRAARRIPSPCNSCHYEHLGRVLDFAGVRPCAFLAGMTKCNRRYRPPFAWSGGLSEPTVISADCALQRRVVARGRRPRVPKRAAAGRPPFAVCSSHIPHTAPEDAHSISVRSMNARWPGLWSTLEEAPFTECSPPHALVTGNLGLKPRDCANATLTSRLCR